MPSIIKLLIVSTGIYLSTNFANAQEDKSFLEVPDLIKHPTSNNNYSTRSRKFTGIPSLAISPEGRFWAVWYTGKTAAEDQNNYVVLSTSDDDGQSWTEVLAIDPDGAGPVRAFDPEIWMDPTGKLWVFWAQTIEHDGTIAGVWTITTDDPNAKEPVWTAPRRLHDGIMMCKPTVLSNGEWMLPVSTWRLTDNSAKAVVSIDAGQTWRERGAVQVPEKFRNFDEHMIIEKKNGILWMLVRTQYGIGESISNDLGVSWSPLVPSRIQHPAARFFIRRLNSGNLLLVKHGPIDKRIGRSHLMAFISRDDGFSWSNGLLLDQRPGVSYPDGQQLSDGSIHIIYDYDRRNAQNILITSFTEDDVLSATDNKMVEVFERRMVVSEGGEGEIPE